MQRLLPECHYFCNFHVLQAQTLYIHVYERKEHNRKPASDIKTTACTWRFGQCKAHRDRIAWTDSNIYGGHCCKLWCTSDIAIILYTTKLRQSTLDAVNRLRMRSTTYDYPWYSYLEQQHMQKVSYWSVQWSQKTTNAIIWAAWAIVCCVLFSSSSLALPAGSSAGWQVHSEPSGWSAA